MQVLEIGFGNYRSIGEEPIWLDLRKKVNVLIGANNCGKSNVLRALERASLGAFQQPLSEQEAHLRDTRLPLAVGVSLNLDEEENRRGGPTEDIRFVYWGNDLEEVRILGGHTFCNCAGSKWFGFTDIST